MCTPIALSPLRVTVIGDFEVYSVHIKSSDDASSEWVVDKTTVYDNISGEDAEIGGYINHDMIVELVKVILRTEDTEILTSR